MRTFTPAGVGLALAPDCDSLNIDSVSIRFAPHRINGWFTVTIGGDGQSRDYLISIDNLGRAQLSAYQSLKIARLAICGEGDEMRIFQHLLATAREPVEIIQSVSDDCRYVMSFDDQSLLAVRLRTDRAEMLRDELTAQLNQKKN